MLTAEQKSKVGQILEAANVAAWDFSRIRALIAILEKYAPLILPFILPFLQPATVTAASGHDAETAMENLSAADWKAIIALILQILAALFPTPAPVPTPTPTPGPVA